jgi:hypothetical protein
VGHRIWFLSKIGEDIFTGGPFRVDSFKGLFPMGPTYNKDGERTGERKRTLVQVYTDFGMRTLAVADIWFKDPRISEYQW